MQSYNDVRQERSTTTGAKRFIQEIRYEGGFVYPKSARQVGWALHSNPKPLVIPCHRVVFADGSLSSGFAFGGAQAQKELLQSEGVSVGEDNKVDLKKYRC